VEKYPSIPFCLYGMRVDTFIYLFIVFQNAYAGVRAMDIGTVKK